MTPSSTRGTLRLPLPQARQATVLSLVLLACFVYVNANWFCSDVYSTMNSLCDGCYAGYDKRTNTISRTTDNEPFVERKTAVDFLKRGTARGSTRRGIVDECCHRPCSVNEMMLYCCEQKQREYYTFVGWLKRR
ncbi:bombyxin A-5-like [Patiria miniata]|uniref:Insulin-like domain-containing protein n=1 Tax=Patiria miniata TaxID=46514 RepID=A0A914BDK7_PATMI|nr:bombyxin A-5-like [Patiria miniata]